MKLQPATAHTPTLKSKSPSEKFLCSAGDRNCVVTTMILQKTKHYTMSLKKTEHSAKKKKKQVQNFAKQASPSDQDYLKKGLI